MSDPDPYPGYSLEFINNYINSLNPEEREAFLAPLNDVVFFLKRHPSLFDILESFGALLMLNIQYNEEWESKMISEEGAATLEPGEAFLMVYKEGALDRDGREFGDRLAFAIRYPVVIVEDIDEWNAGRARNVPTFLPRRRNAAVRSEEEEVGDFTAWWALEHPQVDADGGKGGESA